MGSAISAFIDGVPVYAVTDDAPLAGGGVALGTIGATVEVDRVSAGRALGHPVCLRMASS